MQPTLSDGKAAWRIWGRALPEPSSEVAEVVLNAVREFLRDAKPTGRVLTFRPMTGEIDLDPLLDEFHSAVTRTWSGGRLTVHPAEAAVEHHRWGYLQPVVGAVELPVSEIGLVLVPGLLFDEFGGRLGHGAGYYDRLLPQLPPGIALIGIAAQTHIIERVPTDGHDVSMTHLATERGVRRVRTK